MDGRQEGLGVSETITLKMKSYRASQERLRVAQALLKAEVEHAEVVRSWARECHASERQAIDRCTYLYGLAARLGASDDELRGPVQ